MLVLIQNRNVCHSNNSIVIRPNPGIDLKALGLWSISSIVGLFGSILG